MYTMYTTYCVHVHYILCTCVHIHTICIHDYIQDVHHILYTCTYTCIQCTCTCTCLQCTSHIVYMYMYIHLYICMYMTLQCTSVQSIAYENGLQTSLSKLTSLSDNMAQCERGDYSGLLLPFLFSLSILLLVYQSFLQCLSHQLVPELRYINCVHPL